MHEQPDMFLNEEEIITDMLLYRLSEAEKLTVRSVPLSDIDKMRDELAGPVIQHYRLDDVNNPYTDHDTTKDNYPTKVSRRILDKVWKRLTGKSLILASELVDNGDGTYTLNGAIVTATAIGNHI